MTDTIVRATAEIALGRLDPSPANVRRTGAGQGVEAGHHAPLRGFDLGGFDRLPSCFEFWALAWRESRQPRQASRSGLPSEAASRDQAGCGVRKVRGLR